MRSLLGRCRISCQIAILGLIGVVSVAAVAGIDFWGTSQTGRANAIASAAERSRDLERTAQIELLQSRLLRRDEASISLNTKALATAEDSLDALGKSPALQPGLLAVARQMMLDTRQYATTFATVVQRARVIGISENQGLLGELRVSAHDVEQKLGMIDAPAAQIAMLTMRRHEQEFIARPDPSYGAELKAQLPGFIAAVHASGAPAPVSRDLLEKMQVYQATFAAFQSAMIEQASAERDLTRIHAEIEPRLAEADRQFRDQSDAAQHEAERIAERTHRFALIAIGAIVTAMILLCWLVGRGIAKPIVAVTAAMASLVKGDLTTAIPADRRRDEIGTMIGVMRVLKESLLEVARLRQELEESREVGEKEKIAALIAMAVQIEYQSGDAVAKIVERTATLIGTVEQMHGLAESTGLSADRAAYAAESALLNAQTAASAAEQLSVSVRQISGQVSQSTIVVDQAVEAGQNARTTVEALHERVAQLGAVATITTDIAGRTNLLALSATTEAARAGEYGKGFAVVAGEVKQLADQTAQSTQEITRHVNELSAATDAAIEAVHRIETTINEVNQIAVLIAAAVEEQGVATAEIAANVSGTAKAIYQVTGLNLEVSREAKRAGQNAGDVLLNTRQLGDAMLDLQRIVVRTVRQSATEVNRRLFFRHDTDLACRLEINGNTPVNAQVADISEGGARITGVGNIPSGARGILVIDAMSARLQFYVVGSGTATVRVSFDRDDASQSIIRSVLERLPTRAVA